MNSHRLQLKRFNELINEIWLEFLRYFVGQKRHQLRKYYSSTNSNYFLSFNSLLNKHIITPIFLLPKWECVE